MFCSECGQPAHGKFCSHCGTRLDPAGAASEVTDWENEVRYEILVRVPEVRSAIDRCAAAAPRRMTGEQILGLADKVLSLPVSAETVASIVHPLYTKLGIGTGKRRSERIDLPAGRALCFVLCSLARRGQVVRKATQAGDGCVVEAAIPSDFRSFEGDLFVTVRRDGPATVVEVATRIPGQFFDWGKSRACLDGLFVDLRKPVERLAA